MSAGTAPRVPIAGNFAILISSEGIGQFVALLTSAYLARTLGRDGFGIWVFAASIITYLGYLIDAGTETWGTREISADHGALRKTVGNVMSVRIISAVATLTLLGLATLPLEPARQIALLCGAVTLLANTVQVPWALRGMEIMLPVALGTLLQRCLLFVFALTLARSAASAPYVTLWQGLADVAAATVWLAVLVPKAGLRWRDPFRSHPRATFRDAWPFGLARVLRGAMFTINVALIPLFWSDATAGIYGAALRLAMPMLTLSTIFGMAVFPAITRAIRSGSPEHRSAVLLASFRTLAAFFMPLAVGGIVLAGPLVVFAFSQTYADAALPLQILLAALLCMVVSDNLRRVLHARGKQVRDMRVVMLATGASVMFNLLAIPLLGGFGAALAALASELLLLALTLRVLQRVGADLAPFAAFRRPALAAAAMAGVVLALADFGLFPRILAGAASYLVVLLLIGARPLDDLRQIERPAAT